MTTTDGDWQVRLAAAVAVHKRRRAVRAEVRGDLAQARAYGLVAKHKIKLLRTAGAGISGGDTPATTEGMTDMALDSGSDEPTRPPDYCTTEEWIAWWLARTPPATAEQRALANAALGITTRPRRRPAGGEDLHRDRDGDRGGESRHNSEGSVTVTQTEPAEAGKPDAWIHWDERVRRAGRSLTSHDHDHLRQVSARVIAEHLAQAEAEYGAESDGLAATEAELLDGVAIDWLRHHLVADGVLEPDHAQQFSVHFGRPLARLLETHEDGRHLESSRLILTAASILRAQTDAMARAVAK